MFVGISSHAGRFAPSCMCISPCAISPAPFLPCRNSIWNQDSFTKYWNKCWNLCPLEESDCHSKQMIALLHWTRDFPLIWDIIQVELIFLFLVITGILKSLISSCENRWAGLNCCPFASTDLWYALKLFANNFSFVSIHDTWSQKRGRKKKQAAWVRPTCCFHLCHIPDFFWFNKLFIQRLTLFTGNEKE